MAGKPYMSNIYNSNAVPVSFKAAQLAEERLLAEERALASLSAQPKSGLSGLFARSPVGPSILNRQAASNEAKRKQRSEQQIAAFLASARARNAQANINARIAAHTSTYPLAGSKAYYPTDLNALKKSRGATREAVSLYHPGAAGGKRTRRRRTHKRKTHKRHRSNK
jgi:hypothetical protein